MAIFKYRLNTLETNVLKEFYEDNIDGYEAKVLIDFYEKRLEGNPFDAVARASLTELHNLVAIEE